jgi:hypothetical protein
MALCLAAVWIIGPLMTHTLWLDVTVLSKRIVAIGVPVLLLIAGRFIYNDAIIYLEDHAAAE